MAGVPLPILTCAIEAGRAGGWGERGRERAAACVEGRRDSCTSPRQLAVQRRRRSGRNGAAAHWPGTTQHARSRNPRSPRHGARAAAVNALPASRRVEAKTRLRARARARAARSAGASASGLHVPWRALRAARSRLVARGAPHGRAASRRRAAFPAQRQRVQRGGSWCSAAVRRASQLASARHTGGSGRGGGVWGPPPPPSRRLGGRAVLRTPRRSSSVAAAGARRLTILTG